MVLFDMAADLEKMARGEKEIEVEELIAEDEEELEPEDYDPGYTDDDDYSDDGDDLYVLPGFDYCQAKTAFLMTIPATHGEVKYDYDDYPEFLETEFGIHDPTGYHHYLVRSGYLSYDPLDEAEICKHGRKAMAQYLFKRGLPINGNEGHWLTGLLHRQHHSKRMQSIHLI